MRPFAVLSALVLVGCASAPAPTPEVTRLPPVAEGDLAVPAAWVAEGRKLLDGFAAKARSGESQNPQVAMLASMMHGPFTVRAELEPLHPVGNGFTADASILFTPTSGEEAKLGMKDVYLAPDAKGHWSMLPEVPREETERPRLARVDAHVALDPSTEWLTGDVLDTVEPHGERYLVFSLYAHARAGTGLRIQEISQGGRALPYRVLNDAKVVVEVPDASAAQLVIRFRYQGGLNQKPWGYLSSQDVLLRGAETGWLPLLPYTAASFDVHALHPATLHLFGQGRPQGEVARADGQVETSWHFDRSDAFTLYGAPTYVVRSSDRDGLHVDVAVWPRDADQAEAMEQGLTEALSRIAFLGGYPYPTLNIVESGFDAGKAGYGALSNVAIGSRMWRRPDGLDMAVHETIHGWFGGRVPVTPASLEHGMWNEALTEFTTGWALPEANAKLKRADWARHYAALPAKKEEPITSIGADISDWSVNEAINYSKAPLLLCALEDRLGHEKMAHLLAAFVQARDGKPSDWNDFVSVLAQEDGEPAAAWFRSYLTRTGAPDLHFSQVHAAAGRVTGTLVQTASPVFTGVVQVGFRDAAGGVVSLQKVAFDSARTAFDWPLPKGATAVVLDPDHRFPLRSREETEVSLTSK